ncbi:MAG: hypothetical protein IBX48_01265 [Thiomicrospira sp.]|uniref:hypothetical protein n=1 Tax=Thiomicrospira sp. TaxID=935 RepID=UPI001A0AABBF|nr:hypothetical protein [Thiomicrospira sp.]MBE0492949.1 hypothetical protein [Thiomicrospira sp.]
MRYVLYAMDHHLEAFQFRGKRIVGHKSFNWPDVSEFVSSLALNAQISVILDVVDEDLQVEFMPRLLPWEKWALQTRLATKSRQKGASVQRFIWTGQRQTNEDNRAEEMLLTVALYSSNAVSNLMSQLSESNYIWTSLHSSAFLLKRLLRSYMKGQLKLTANQTKAPILLVVRMSERHYRQCFFLNGHLRLTRIVEIKKDQETDLSKVEFLAQESKLATRFIYSQKILPQGAPFNYIIVDHVDESLVENFWSIFEKAGVISPRWDKALHFFDVVNLVNRVSMPTDDLCYGNAVLAQSLQAGWVPSFFSNPAIKKVNRFRYAGFALKILAGLVVIAIGFGVVKSSLEDRFLDRQQDLFQQVEQSLQIQKKHLIAELEGQVKSQDMQAAVQFSDQLNKMTTAQPYGLDLVALAELLSRHPKIKIEQIRWQPLNQFDDNQLKVTVRGQVHPFDGQYKPITQALNALESDLTDHPSIDQIVFLQKPFSEDQSQGQSLQVGRDTRALPFSLEWVMHARQTLKDTP